MQDHRTEPSAFRFLASSLSRFVTRASVVSSISGLLLTTEALVTNLDKDDAKKRKAEGSVR